MEPTVPNPTPPARCPVPWCRNGHRAPDTRHSHTRDLETIDFGTSYIGVNLLQVQDGDEFGPAVIRVHYGPDFTRGPEHRIDIPGAEAGRLAEALGMLTTHTTPDFIAALARGAALLRGDAR